MAEAITTDVAVVGAGPAGIAAACRAAESGAAVVVFDEGFAPGGQIWRGSASQSWRARRWAARLRRTHARLVTGATVVDAMAEDAGGFDLLADAKGPLRVHTRRLIIATGARERFLPFPGWTLPGVLGVGAAQALLKSGASFRGARVVVAGSGPLLLPVAALLSRDGARVGFVAEQAPGRAVAGFAAGLWRRPWKLLEATRYRADFLGAPYRPGVWVSSATGAECVREVALTDGARSWTVDCDLLCCSYGLVGNVELARLLGCTVEGGTVSVGGDQQTSVAGVYAAGEPTGIAGVDQALLEGEIAGLAAAGRPAAASALAPRRESGRAFAAALESAFRLRPELRRLPRPETIVCRCEDVVLGRLEPAWTPRQAKLYTRAGMGPCQGRICGPALELLFGWETDAPRPPLKPCALSTLGSAPPGDV